MLTDLEELLIYGSVAEPIETLHLVCGTCYTKD
jgi:hypothetical protein